MKKKNFRDFFSVSKSYGNQGDSKRPSSRPLDDGESSILGIRHGINDYNEKFSAPNFGAIRKWMTSKVGKPFDSVLAEICAMCGKSSRGQKMKKYFLDCIWDDIMEKDGKYFSKKTGCVWHPASVRGMLFIAQDGRLGIVPKKYK
jgi:hypothetical protein